MANTNNPKGRSDDRFFATAHEYILFYSKDRSLASTFGFKPPERVTKRYNKKDAESKLYREIDLRKTGDEDRREDREDMFYFFFFDEQEGALRVSRKDAKKSSEVRIIPLRNDGSEGRWRWGFDTAKKDIERLTARYIPQRKIWGVFERDYLEGRKPIKPTTSWVFKDVNSEGGTEALIKLGFKKEVFPRPKPIGTLKRVLEISMPPSSRSIALDFFAGSGTTAHAVMALNVADGGKRKHITVQLDEPTDEKSEARKAGYETIFQITRDRILKAADKLKEEFPDVEVDYGFKEFKTVPVFEGYLDEAESLDQYDVFDGDSLSDEQRAQLLLTWQVYDGLPITLELTPVELEGYTAYKGEHILYFMNSGLNLDHIIAMLGKLDSDDDFAPRKLVIFEYVLSSKAKREITEAINGFNNRKQIELRLEIRA